MAELFPAKAETDCGAFGVVDGVTEFDADDEGLWPVPFVAFTVKVYAVPFASPATVHENVVDVSSAATSTVQVFAPGSEVAV